MRTPVNLLCCCLAVITFGAGCGGSSKDPNQPDTVNVEGVILYQQKPVADANVIFAPEDHSHAAVGKTDSSGRFRLRTFAPNDGAVPGNFKVTVMKYEQSGSAGDSSLSDAELESRPDSEGSGPPKSLVPARYAQARTSDLTANITADGENKFEFELKD